jgi:hypothetical protein
MKKERFGFDPDGYLFEPKQDKERHDGTIKIFTYIIFALFFYIMVPVFFVFSLFGLNRKKDKKEIKE